MPGAETRRPEQCHAPESGPERSGLERDLAGFLAVFGLATVAIFVPHSGTRVRELMALSLVLMYFVCLLPAIRASARLVTDGHGTEADPLLFLARLGLPGNLVTIVAQPGVGLTLFASGTLTSWCAAATCGRATWS